MKSGIRKRIRKPFILNEDGIRRIVGVIEKNAKDLQFQTEIVFRVEREDDRFYETDSIDEVLADPNVDGKRISSLSLDLVRVRGDGDERYYYGSLVTLKFAMDSKERIYSLIRDGIHFEIDNHEKAWSLLLADALEPQIERAVNNNGMPKLLIIGLAVVVIYCAARGFSFLKDEGSIGLKDFIAGFIAVFGLGFLISMTNGSAILLNRIIGPETAFLWGQQEERFMKRESVRRNIFWGVFIAFLVSVCATVFLEFI